MKLNSPLMRDGITFDPHQVDGVKWMAARPRFLLADEPGLGKSLQSLALGSVIPSRPKILVVSPAQIKTNFAAEVEKFTHFACTVLVGSAASTREKRIRAFADDPTAEVLIVGYEQVVGHQEALEAVGFGYVIADEAHYAKNPGAQRTQALMAVAGTAGRLCLMTGTPLENNPSELWPLMEMIAPGRWGTFEEFCEFWCVFKEQRIYRKLKYRHRSEVEDCPRCEGRGPACIDVITERKIVGCTDPEALHRMLEPFMLRRSSDVLELEEPRFIPVMLPMLAKQAKLYKQAEEESEITLTVENLTIPDNRVAVGRLLQLTSTTATIDGFDDTSAKLDWAMTHVEQLGQSHVVMFTNFQRTALAAVTRLRARGMKAVRYSGDMTQSKRDEAFAHWIANGGVLVATSKAAGTGLNGAQEVANHVIVLEKPWTPARYEQMWKRVHRRGQTKPVLIYEPKCEGTVDEMIDKVLERKAAMADVIVDGGKADPEWDDDELDEWLEGQA